MDGMGYNYGVGPARVALGRHLGTTSLMSKLPIRGKAGDGVREVIQEAVNQLDTGKPCVLATVVRTKGSTPQKAGAMLLVRDDGSAVGTLGGGCVEGDIWFAAREILRGQGGPAFKDYYLNEDIAARDGLVCGGTMYFYLEPFWDTDDFADIGRELLGAYDGAEPAALATVVRSDGDTARLGAKLLLRSDGTIAGGIGTAALDEIALEAAGRVAAVGANESVDLDAHTELFVEGFTTPPTLVMVGGGHVGKATADLAHRLGYRVYVVDDRADFANAERFPYAADTIVAPYADWAQHLELNVNSFIVVASRGHWFDDVALESALTTRARYIGLLGSRRKTLMIYQRLLQEGVPRERLAEVRAPVGLDIGALEPEELAVSIMSEVIMARRGGKGSPMTMDGWYLERAERRALRGAAAD